MSAQTSVPVVSVVIVNYRVPDFLTQVLRSLRDADLYGQAEVIVVDNASGDNSQAKITTEFSEVIWIALKNNIGFGKACNVGAKKAVGKYILFLNPDTLVSENTLTVLTNFLDTHNNVGIVGPKVIWPDGSFQPPCRRSFPRPFDAFAHFSGLSRLFPKNPLFGKYLLNHLSPNESMEIDAVSGSCMMIRKELFSQIQGFDSAFFMFGEDLDLCAQCREKGYKVWYVSDTQIIHFKGKSSAKRVVRSRFAFWNAMVLFSKKYNKTYGAFFPGWIITLGILFFGGLNLVMVLFRSYIACFIDLILVNSILFGTTLFRFFLLGRESPYLTEDIRLSLFMHGLMSLCFLFANAFRGGYSSEHYSAKNILVSGFTASAIFMSTVFYFQIIAFSRIAFLASAVLIPLSQINWRIVLPKILTKLRRRIYTTGDVLIVGNGAIASNLIKNIEKDSSARIQGIVWPVETDIPGEFEGYPVQSSLGSLTGILKKQHVDLLVIATEESWYSSVIEALTFLHLKHMGIKWVPPELFKKTPNMIPGAIPLNDFSV